jgi:hypothetical protein
MVPMEKKLVPIVCVIGGVGLNENQIELLAKRQVPLSKLKEIASRFDDEAMKRYIGALLDSRGGQDEAGGPGIDSNCGVSN